MLSSLKASTSGLRRAVLEKAGKVQGTQETEEFTAKVQSLIATEAAFKNLQRVGKSIFANNKAEDAPVNPADAFLGDIKEVMNLKRDYEKKRRQFDSAQDALAIRQEEAKKPGKNQAKKEVQAQEALETRDSKQKEYETARDTLGSAIDTLEGKRDEQFKDSVSAMCRLLQNLQPDWEQIDSEAKSQDSGASGGDEQKDDGASPLLGASGVQSQDTGEGENTQNQTDSESD